jgi:hypothetical protein
MVGIAGIFAGGTALGVAALLAVARAAAPSAPVPVRVEPDPSLTAAVALLSGEAPRLGREPATVAVRVPFRPIPEPDTAALVALGLALLPLARSRSACHPAR